MPDLPKQSELSTHKSEIPTSNLWWFFAFTRWYGFDSPWPASA